MAGPDLRTPQAIARAVDEAASHYRLGRLDDADRICSRILKAAPDWFDALHLSGLVKLEAGKAAAAHVLLVKALKLNPASPLVMGNLARALSMLERDEEAMAFLDRALALAPDSVDAINGRGNVLLKLGRVEDAVAAFDRALTLAPKFAGARANLGNALARLARNADALAHYDVLVAEHPAQPEFRANRAAVLVNLGRYDDALAAYDQVLAFRPDSTRARLGRGAALAALNRHEDALAEYRAVLAGDRSDADARHNEALSLLTLGDYRRGFEAYEARWLRTGMARRRSMGKPLWLGEYPLQRKTILLHAEQGLGDTIQFARYAPRLARAGARVILAAQPELTTLLARLEGVAQALPQAASLPAYDVHCPLGSLPLALRTELATIPGGVPYLGAAPERIAAWRPRLERLPGPCIAIVWAGRAEHPNDRNRSIALERLAPWLATLPGSVVSLQRELRPGDAATLARLPNVTHVGDGLTDFEDTAAVLALADLTISVDTSVVHLAGAMGRPVFVLLPFQPDWRWLLDRADTPWYPSARLFRQSAPGVWDGVLAQVGDAVSRL